MPPLDVTHLRATLADALAWAMHGDPWHGPALSPLLRTVDAEQARATPLPGVHSIWAIVLHMTAWADEVARRVVGEPPATPRAGDWPPLPEVQDEAAWRAAILALDLANDRARHALHHCEGSRLLQYVGGIERHLSLGAGVTHAAMLAGLAQHHAYHGGQIALLRKVLGVDR
jgi:uncharacterized damage-inducible protein DinB